MAGPCPESAGISRVGRLGVLAVTDWVVESTTYNFDGRRNCQYNCRGRASRILLVRVSAWVRLRARARKWARFWAWTRVLARVRGASEFRCLCVCVCACACAVQMRVRVRDFRLEIMCVVCKQRGAVGQDGGRANRGANFLYQS